MTSSGNNIWWLTKRQCPACGGEAAAAGQLFQQEFYFGGSRISTKEQPVTLRRCCNCRLIFKTPIASPALLERLTAASETELWSSTYNYVEELATIAEVDPSATNDVIDIGAAGGAFLDSMPSASRKSALDIIRFTSLNITGEFIRGFIDSTSLEWSQNPYRLVGMFDVAEHLYDPPRAFANLRRLCRLDGLVILETGDSDTVLPHALPTWYYLNLIEHHLAWNETSLTEIACRSGFEVVSIRRKRHKTANRMRLRDRIKAKVFGISPEFLRSIYFLLQRPFEVPGDNSVDHIQLILRAI